MGQKMVILLPDWSEEDEQGEMGDVGKWRLSHLSLLIGEGEWECSGEEVTDWNYQ